jgi:hypothetical protein
MRDTITLAQHFFVAAVRSLLVVALTLFGSLAAYVLYLFMRRRIRAYRSPLRNVPRPRKAHWLKSNFVDVQEGDAMNLQAEWVKTYGHILKCYSGFGVRISLFFCQNIRLYCIFDYPAVCSSPNSWPLTP